MDKVNVAKSLLSAVRFYINPDLYNAEIELERKQKEEAVEEEKPNKARNLFDDISIRSKEDGIFRMPKELRDILKKQPPTTPEPVDNEEDVVG